jgi:hypothetical protein
VLLAAGGLLLHPSTAATARRPRPVLCPGGRFLVVPADAPLLSGSSSPSPDAVVIGSPAEIAIPLCGAVRATTKAGKRFTTVKGRWPSCGDLRNVRLTAKIVPPGCGELRGMLKVKKRRPKAFLALRSACGDEQVDPANGEACDPSAPNGDEACPGACGAPGSLDACHCTVGTTTSTTVAGSSTSTSATTTSSSSVTTTTRRGATTTTSSSTTTTSTATTTTSTAPPTEIPLSGRKLRIIDKGAPRQKLVAVLKDPGVQKGAAGDPSGLSGMAHVFYTDDPANAAVYDLGSSGWTLNKPSVAKYVNRSAPQGGGVKLTSIRVGKLLKLVARNLGDASQLNITNPPGVGGVTVVITISNANDSTTQQMCTNFPSARRAAPGKLIMGEGVPAECSTVTTTTTPTTTSTMPVITCDPLLQDCPEGMGCYLLTDEATCEPVGAGIPPGGECVSPTDCAPGAGCFRQTDVLLRCFSFCDFALYPNVHDPTHCAPDTPRPVCRSIRGSTSVGICIR